MGDRRKLIEEFSEAEAVLQIFEQQADRYPGAGEYRNASAACWIDAHGRMHVGEDRVGPNRASRASPGRRSRTSCGGILERLVGSPGGLLMGRSFLGGTGLSFGPGIATGVQRQEG